MDRVGKSRRAKKGSSLIDYPIGEDHFPCGGGGGTPCPSEKNPAYE